MKTSILAVAAAFSLLGAGPASAEDFKLSSPDVAQGQPIKASQYWNSFGCSGANERPALQWTGAPQGTKSFAVTFYDRDAPTGSGFWHWVIYNIPASARGIPASAIPDGAIQGKNDVGMSHFIGPCPPVGRTHTYTFTVHALKAEKLEVPEGASAALSGFFIYQNTIAKATLDVTAGPRAK